MFPLFLLKIVFPLFLPTDGQSLVAFESGIDRPARSLACLNSVDSATVGYFFPCAPGFLSLFGGNK